MTRTESSRQERWPPKETPEPRQGVIALFKTPGRTALFYLVLLALAEATTTLADPRAGLVMHGLVLVTMFLHASLWARSNERRFLMCLALAPLIRLMSLSLPLPDYPFVYWYLVVGVPLFLAAYMAARAGKMNFGMVSLTGNKWLLQLLVGATGATFGYVEYLILRPAPLISELSLGQFWLPALILLIFTGFLEELIFRGMLQYSAIRSFGWIGLVYVALVFAVLHLGYHSLVDVLFVLGVALFFGLVTLRTGSILGVSISHGLTNVGLYLVFPFIFASPLAPQGTPVTVPTPVAPVLLAPQPTGLSTQTPLHLAVTPSGQPSTASATPTGTKTISPITITTRPIVATLSVTVRPSSSLVSPELGVTQTRCQPRTGWVLYTVKSRDTLSALSVRTGASVQALRSANCLTSDLIITGQKLYLPVHPVVPTRQTLTPTVMP